MKKLLCSDAIKAYYVIKTGELEKHVRGVCEGYGKSSSHWRTYEFNTVSFGDRLAAFFLENTIRRTADIDMLAATRFKNDR